MLYQSERAAGGTTAEGAESPTELQIGCGTKPVSTSKMFFQGDVNETGNSLDFALEGDGFFQLQMPDGTLAYTRDGSFKLSSDGQLVNSDGYFLEPSISIPTDTQGIMISRDGILSVVVSGESESQDIGQIEIAKFMNPAGLKNVGRNLLTETGASGEPMVGTTRYRWLWWNMAGLFRGFKCTGG